MLCGKCDGRDGTYCQNIAEKIYERHNVLAEALKLLGVSEAVAAADACKIEHNISDESFEAIKRHLTNKS